MGVYKVLSNGSAPKGLSVGDHVVTGGGTYIITGINADGSYKSSMYNAAQTTYNYTGKYDELTQAGAVTGNMSMNEANDAGALEDYYLDLLQQTMQGDYSAGGGAMSFDEAVSLAAQALEPQYNKLYKQTATKAAQRLEKAGLYDTLYGQALAADAENAVHDELNAAIYTLALQLSGDSADAQEDQRQVVLNYLWKLVEDQNAQKAKLAQNNS